MFQLTVVDDSNKSALTGLGLKTLYIIRIIIKYNNQKRKRL